MKQDFRSHSGGSKALFGESVSDTHAGSYKVADRECSQAWPSRLL
jgi:hypothetical protein